MKDLLLCVHLGIKTLNFEMSPCLWQTTSKISTKVRAARAARLFFLIQPIRSLFSGVVVAVAVVISDFILTSVCEMNALFACAPSPPKGEV